MPESFTVRLPWPPSVNSYLQPMRNGRGKYITRKGKEFRESVCSDVVTLVPMEGRLTVSLELTPPDRRARDLDNHIKSTLDALECAGVYLDDSQIDELIVRRMPVESPGCCDVTITQHKE